MHYPLRRPPTVKVIKGKLVVVQSHLSLSFCSAQPHNYSCSYANTPPLVKTHYIRWRPLLQRIILTLSFTLFLGCRLSVRILRAISSSRLSREFRKL